MPFDMVVGRNGGLGDWAWEGGSTFVAAEIGPVVGGTTAGAMSKNRGTAMFKNRNSYNDKWHIDKVLHVCSYVDENAQVPIGSGFQAGSVSQSSKQEFCQHCHSTWCIIGSFGMF